VKKEKRKTHLKFEESENQRATLEETDQLREYPSRAKKRTDWVGGTPKKNVRKGGSFSTRRTKRWRHRRRKGKTLRSRKENTKKRNHGTATVRKADTETVRSSRGRKKIHEKVRLGKTKKERAVNDVKE